MCRFGLDVSDNQGVIDWKMVKEAGVKFAILRTVRRSSKIDKQLENNIKGCIANGIPADFYKYGYALTEAESEREAKEVVLALETLGIKPAKDVVIWHDVEDDSQMALSTAQLTKICQAFKKVVEDAGYTYEYHIDDIARMVLVTASWNFSFGRDYKSKSKRMSNSDSDSGVM